MEYLDCASATPVSKTAERAYMKALKAFGNPSSPHAEGEKARIILEQARKDIAKLAEVKSECVIFTSGATEANALAIQGHIKALLHAGKKIEQLHVLYLPTAHSSIVDTFKLLGEQGAYIEPIALKEYKVDLAALKKQLRPETALVSMDLVCGETGTKFATRDVRRVIDAAHKEWQAQATAGAVHADAISAAKPSRALLHVDASQAPSVESFELIRLGADLLTLDAQKVNGVRGTGVLIRANALTPLSAIMQGGGQEQGIRPGTENVAGAAAFAAALLEAQNGKEEFRKRASEARTVFLRTLTSAFPDILVNGGEDATQAPHILNISFPGRDTDYAVMLLSEAGFAVSTKSACETDAVGSRVVFTFTGDEARALSTLRISWAPGTPKSSLQKLAKELIKTIEFLDLHTI
jgi:cysteine desulfurase